MECFVLLIVSCSARPWQTDRRTDGNAIASTVLAMRALRRAVKIDSRLEYISHCRPNYDTSCEAILIVDNL